MLISIQIQNRLIIVRISRRELESIRGAKRIDKRLYRTGNDNHAAVAAILVFDGYIADQAEGQSGIRLEQRLCLEGARTMVVVAVSAVWVFNVPVHVADEGGKAQRDGIRHWKVACHAC